MSSLTAMQINRLKKRAAAGSVCLAIVLIIIKTFGVLATGSLSVLSSMIDSLADLFASSITFIAIRFSSQPADCEHRYGHGKAEALSALIQSAFIAGSGIFVIYDGITRFISPRPLEQTGIGILVMVVSLILTLFLIAYQRYVAHRTNSQAIRADSAHYTVDVVTNISIIITLLVVHYFGFYWFDTLAAFLVSAYLLLNAYRLAADAVSLLLDRELSNSVRENIKNIVLSLPQIRGMHDLRTRDLGGRYIFEFHLELDGELTLNAAHRYCEEAEAEIHKLYPTAQIIIHQDPAGLQEDRLDHNLVGNCRI